MPWLFLALLLRIFMEACVDTFVHGVRHGPSRSARIVSTHTCSMA